MRYRGGERGVSFVSLMFVLGCAVLVGLKLFPVYMQSFKFDSAMKSVIEDSKVSQRSKNEILRSLLSGWISMVFLNTRQGKLARFRPRLGK